MWGHNLRGCRGKPNVYPALYRSPVSRMLTCTQCIPAAAVKLLSFEVIMREMPEAVSLHPSAVAPGPLRLQRSTPASAAFLAVSLSQPEPWEHRGTLWAGNLKWVQGGKGNQFNQPGKLKSVSFWPAHLGSGLFAPSGKVTVDLILPLLIPLWIRTEIGVSEVGITSPKGGELKLNVFLSLLV